MVAHASPRQDGIPCRPEVAGTDTDVRYQATTAHHLSPGQLPENQSCTYCPKDYRNSTARFAGWHPLALGRTIVTPGCARKNDRQHHEENPDDNCDVHDFDP